MLYVTAASRAALKFNLDMKLMTMVCMSVRRLVLPMCDWVVSNVMYSAFNPCAGLIVVEALHIESPLSVWQMALFSSIANLIGNRSLHTTTVGVSLKMRVIGFR